MDHKRFLNIPCINNAFQRRLRVNLCKTCIDFKRERDFYKERCRFYEKQNEELYKQLNGKGRFLNNIRGEVCECCTCKKSKVIPREGPEENQAENLNSNLEVAPTLYTVVRELPADVGELSPKLIGWPMVAHDELTLHLKQQKEHEKVTEQPEETQKPLEVVRVKLEEVETEEVEPEEVEPEEQRAEENADILLTCCWVLGHGPDPSRECGKVFKAVHEIVPHIRDEHDSPSGDYVCYWPDCERKCRPFKKKWFFLYHIARVHTGEVWYSCPVEDCSKTFLCFDEMDAHKNKHEEIKVYCLYPGCTKVFNNTARVHDHYRIFHMGSRSYKCPVQPCEEEFASMKALVKHERWHERMKMLRCEFPGCDSTFTDKLSFELHEQAHEQEFDESWRECDGKRPRMDTDEEENFGMDCGLSGVTFDGDSSEGQPRKPLIPCRRDCGNKISPELQKTLYDEYWSLGEYKRRKMYLCSLIEVERRTDSAYRQKLRKPTLHDFNRRLFVSVNGDRIEVCNRCFGRIFGEKQETINSITLEMGIAVHPNPVIE